MLAVDSRVRGTDLVARTERVERLREVSRRAPMHAESERISAFTAVWKETEGLPRAIRRARALRRYLETCTVVIFDDELIVGSSTRFQLGVHAYLEYRSDLCEDLFAGKAVTVRRETETAIVADEDRKAFAEAAAYWTGRSTVDRMHQEVEEILVPCNAYKFG